MTTGERIKEARKRLGLSAEKIAEKIKVSPATIYRWEKGDIEKVPASMLEPLADALQTTPEFLMGWGEVRSTVRKQIATANGVFQKSIVSDSPWDPDTMLWPKEDDDIRIMARGMKKLPKEKREQLLRIARVMFEEDFDEEGNRKR